MGNRPVGKPSLGQRQSMAEFMGSIENQRALKMSLVAQVHNPTLNWWLSTMSCLS